MSSPLPPNNMRYDRPNLCIDGAPWHAWQQVLYEGDSGPSFRCARCRVRYNLTAHGQDRASEFAYACPGCRLVALYIPGDLTYRNCPACSQQIEPPIVAKVEQPNPFAQPVERGNMPPVRGEYQRIELGLAQMGSSAQA